MVPEKSIYNYSLSLVPDAAPFPLMRQREQPQVRCLWVLCVREQVFDVLLRNADVITRNRPSALNLSRETFFDGLGLFGAAEAALEGEPREQDLVALCAGQHAIGFEVGVGARVNLAREGFVVHLVQHGFRVTRPYFEVFCAIFFF